MFSASDTTAECWLLLEEHEKTLHQVKDKNSVYQITYNIIKRIPKYFNLIGSNMTMSLNQLKPYIQFFILDKLMLFYNLNNWLYLKQY